jgi:membrane fusion protein (multidrug efflux system)
MKNSILKHALIISVSALAVSCGSKTDDKNGEAELAKLKQEQKELNASIDRLEKANPQQQSVRKVPVVVTSMVPSQFRTYIEIQGRVDADQVVNASPENMGVVKEIFVRNGQYVNKGQVLASLKSEALIDDEIDKGIAELEQQISFAKLLYDKQKRLWDQEIGTEIQLLSAKNNYDALLKKKASIEVGRKRIDIAKRSFNIIAPISGVVDAVEIKVGQAVSPGIPNLIRIVNSSKLKVKADIPENYAAQIGSGTDAILFFPDIKDTLVTKISYVAQTINQISRTFEGEINLVNNGRYKPNMIAKVKIVTYANLSAFVLPEGLIQKTGNGDFVYVADANNKAKLIPVTLGRSYNSKVEITSGLNLDDKVITTGFEELNEGDALAVGN